jgi:transposase-like protein
VDYVSVYRWVQRFTPLLIDAARPCRHAPGDRWFVDETYVKVAGRCRAAAYSRVIEELIPAACHLTEQYANNSLESDHGRLKARLRPIRGLKRLRSARVIGAGYAFIPNLRRGHYELGVEVAPRYRLPAALSGYPIPNRSFR